ncbi:MAG: hydrolase 1, exosortase A system-associated [Rhodothalassiaceae bacterium]
MTNPTKRPAEEALILDCEGSRLVAILHRPAKPARSAVLIIVGGPQYRVGGHRLFVRLARHLAREGHAVLRFDYRGMGDSDGGYPGFEHLAPDIRTAIDALFAAEPGIETLGLWGLCNAASASAFYAPMDRRVTRIMMLNPWVRDEEAYDEVLLRHYYTRRLFEAEFWRNLFTGRVRLFDFPALVLRLIRRRLGRGRNASAQDQASPLARKLMRSLARFDGEVGLILSGNDLTAREFEQEMEKLPHWKALIATPRLSVTRLPEADHTFSDPPFSDAVIKETSRWAAGEAAKAASS